MSLTEKQKEYKRRYREKHLEEIRRKDREYKKEYYKTHPRTNRNDYNPETWAAWFEKNKDKKRAQCREYRRVNRRKEKLKLRYNMTLEEYDLLLQEQNGVCAVCGGTNGNQLLFVDHDHTTGKVRGLLCKRCNYALGWANDDPDILNALAEYVVGR